MDIAYGSWPTWWGAFDPYGAEIDTNVTTNNYKFSGKERDTESGLDYSGASSLPRGGILNENPENYCCFRDRLRAGLGDIPRKSNLVLRCPPDDGRVPS